MKLFVAFSLATMRARERFMKAEDIQKIGVVGAGVMGYGIATNFALWNYPVIVHDLDDGILQKAYRKMEYALAVFTEEGLISGKRASDTLSRVSFTTELSQLAAKCDFITEAVVEISSEKRKLFNMLDKLCPPRTILASNTSSLVLSDFGGEVERQDKIIITHYFDPPHIVPGVEIAKGPGTSEETFDLTYELMKKIHKIPVKVLQERPGYLLNSIQSALSREAMRLWSEGAASAEDIELGITATFGFRMFYEGPMRHYDLAGIWKWPPEARTTVGRKRSGGSPELSEKAAGIIKKRMAEGKPWFLDPVDYEAEVKKRDRAYTRRLKELYWPRYNGPNDKE